MDIKVKNFIFRLTEKEHDMLKEEAYGKRMSMSDIIRNALDKYYRGG